MKPIELTVEDLPHSGDVDKNGEFLFHMYTSNMCDGELEEAMPVLMKLWEENFEVNLTVTMRTRDLFNQLFDMYNVGGKMDLEDAPRFQALRNDCQWIIDQIDKMEMTE